MKKQLLTLKPDKPWLCCLLPPLIVVTSLPAIAQVTPDGTLPNNSIVSPNGNNIRIDGGTTAGTNLFHSFQEFSVPPGGEVWFNNSLEIRSIFSRVTGASASNIDGILKANDANLFLLNPNGIIFGKDARLNIGGSFLATTAESFVFGDGIEFGAGNSQQTPLLTINLPIGLQFGATPAGIEVKGPGHDLTADRDPGFAINRDRNRNRQALRVPTSETLALVGGEVTLTGGNLTAESGRIELGSVGSNSRVSLAPTDSGFSLGYNGVGSFGDIQLQSHSSVDASGAGGGDIQVQGRRVGIFGDSVILSLTEGSLPGGNLTVNASESVEAIATGMDIETPSSLLTQSKNSGSAGNIAIATGQLTLRNGAQISTSSFSNGPGGDLSIDASSIDVAGTVFLRDSFGFRPSSLVAGTEGSAAGGNLRINSDRLSVSQGAVMSTVTRHGEQPGGDITINTRQLRVFEGGEISTGTFGAGDAGDLFVNASNSAIVSAGGLFSTAETREPNSPPKGAGGTITVETRQLFIENDGQISTSTAGIGNGGDIIINAQNLRVLNQSEISANTLAQGDAGNLFVNASNYVIVSAGGLFSQVETIEPNRAATGAGGNITVETRQLFLENGGQISASTQSIGNAGNLLVRASESIEASGTGQQNPSGLSSQVDFIRIPGRQPIALPTGSGGNLTIETRQLRVLDGAQISAGTSGLGAGGTVKINVMESVEVRGSVFVAPPPPGSLPPGMAPAEATSPRVAPSAITTITLGRQNAGNLTINTNQLTVADGGQITASTSGSGQGGILNINADSLLEVRGTGIDSRLSRITARTEGRGNAGNLTITTPLLRVSDRAEINVSSSISELNPMLTEEDLGGAGELNINASQLLLENQGSITAETRGGFGNISIDSDNIQLRENSSITTDAFGADRGGNITIDSEDIRLQENSRITTSAFGADRGGNISIDSELVTALNDSDIRANAEDDFGGQIIIDALGIVGARFEEEPIPRSDITASSELGPDFRGTVEINTPVEPIQGLIEFDERIVDVNRLIDDDLCRQTERSEFRIIGQGGLSAPPSQGGIDVRVWEDRREANPPQPPEDRGEKIDEENLSFSREDFVEAQGWVERENGDIELIVNPNRATPAPPWFFPPNCEKLSSIFSPGVTENPTTPGYLVASTSLVANPPLLKVAIANFDIEDNTAIKDKDILEQIDIYQKSEPLSFQEVLEIRAKIAQLYVEKGYITSGAFIPPQTIQPNGTLTIKVVEGTSPQIQVNTSGRLNESYIKDRLELATSAPLNKDKLFEALQLLQLDPLIKKISAELSADVEPGSSILNVEVTEADPWKVEPIANNTRTPSVGTFRRGARVGYSNLSGIGDRINLAYANTEGSNTVDAAYTIPINPQNGTLEFYYKHQANDIIEPPFNRLDIEADANTFELGYRQPILQTPTEEIALGLTTSLVNTQTSILGEDSPIYPGADNNGSTNLSVLRFFQEYTHRGKEEILALRSEFNVGLGILGATVNDFGPDSRFFNWRGQGQWVRRLGTDTLFVLRGAVQLSPTELVPLEQFSLGGYQTVRGYRQDSNLSDSGAFASAEVRVPISWLSSDDVLVQLVPFVDGGVVWNAEGRDIGSDSLASVGLGLQVELWEDFAIRLDYGVPLVDVDSRDRTWQENGFYFSVFTKSF